MIAALNGLKVMACDIQNAYLTAKCHEKIKGDIDIIIPRWVCWIATNISSLYFSKRKLNRRSVTVGVFDTASLIWTRAGPEFGSEEGSILIVVMALYDLKSSGTAFRALLLTEMLYNLSYKPSNRQA